jgi:hypothetical protein
MRQCPTGSTLTQRAIARVWGRVRKCHPYRAARVTWLSLCVLALASCSHISSVPEFADSPLERSGELRQCEALFFATDSQVVALGMRDAQDASVAGFPYLRVSRFASQWGRYLSDEPKDVAAGASVLGQLNGSAPTPTMGAWVAHLRELDRTARSIEIRNASLQLDWPALGAVAPAQVTDSSSLLAALDTCAHKMSQHDLSEPAWRHNLFAKATVPSSYSIAARVMGLYPLTGLLFSHGVARLHANARQTFATAPSALPVAGTLRRYTPALTRAAYAHGDVERLNRRAVGLAGWPDVSHRRAIADLLDIYAPSWVVDTTGDFDRVGFLAWSPGGLNVAKDTPAVYQFASRTYVDGKVLLQLNYVVWFSERPQGGMFDLLAGKLDGLMWRVTLDTDGQVLVADIVHNCGCYHMMFPSSRLAARPPSPNWEEPMLVPQLLPAFDPLTERLSVRLAARTHYAVRVSKVPGKASDVNYQLMPYDALRSLPGSPHGYASAFAPNGLIEGTERAERWLFWPMGVASAGAMRQRGHHAVAFIGQRHFDAPGLVDRYFVRTRASK